MSAVKIKSSFFLDIVKENEKLEIPIFQRDYSWTKDIFLVVWNEIVHPINQYFLDVTNGDNLYYNFKKDYKNFLISSKEYRNEFYKQKHNEENQANKKVINLENNITNFLGNLIILKEKNDLSKIDIVDGQQRLSTIFIIIASLLQKSLSKNNFFLNKLYESIIIQKNSFENKIKLQYSRENQEAYQQWIKIFNLEKNEKNKWTSKNSNIIKFFELSNKELQSFFNEAEAKKEEKNIIIEFIVARIMKIQFSITEIDNLGMAFDVFQKTNSNFTPLAQSDLIKSNYIKVMSLKKINNNAVVNWDKMSKNLFDNKEKNKDKKLTSFLRYSTTIYKIIDKNNKSKIYIKEKSLFKNEFEKKEKDKIQAKINFALKLSKIYKQFFRIERNEIENTKYNLLWNRFLNTKNIKVLSLYTLYLAYIYKEKHDLSNSLFGIEHFNDIIKNLEDFFIKAFKINGIKSQDLDANLPKIIKEIHENKTWKNDEYIFNKNSSAFLIKETNEKFEGNFTIDNNNDSFYKYLSMNAYKESKNWSSKNRRYLISKSLACHDDDIKFKKINSIKINKLTEILSKRFFDIESKELKEKAINYELKIDLKNYSTKQKRRLDNAKEKYNQRIFNLIDDIQILINDNDFDTAKEKYLNSGEIFVKFLEDKNLLI